jgi:hypothetical protein
MSTRVDVEEKSIGVGGGWVSSVSKKDDDDDDDDDDDKETTSLTATVTSSQKKTKKKRQKSVQFPSSPQLLVTQSHRVPPNAEYDRSAVPIDIFSCDICHAVIPSGIRGFEPYATCPTCQEGFDVCGVCCGFSCRSGSNRPSPPSTIVRLKWHPHELTVIDRQAEVAWANGKAAATSCSQTTKTKEAAKLDDDDDDDDDSKKHSKDSKRKRAAATSHPPSATQRQRKRRRTL